MALNRSDDFSVSVTSAGNPTHFSCILVVELKLLDVRLVGWLGWLKEVSFNTVKQSKGGASSNQCWWQLSTGSPILQVQKDAIPGLELQTKSIS